LGLPGDPKQGRAAKESVSWSLPPTSSATMGASSWNAAMLRVDQEATEQAWDAILLAINGEDGVDMDAKVRQLFMDFDSDSSMILDLEELGRGLKSIGVAITDRQTRAFIRSVDVDGDHQISCSEFLVHIHKVMTEREEVRIKKVGEEARDLIKQASFQQKSFDLRASMSLPPGKAAVGGVASLLAPSNKKESNTTVGSAAAAAAVLSSVTAFLEADEADDADGNELRVAERKIAVLENEVVLLKTKLARQLKEAEAQAASSSSSTSSPPKPPKQRRGSVSPPKRVGHREHGQAPRERERLTRKPPARISLDYSEKGVPAMGTAL